MNIVVSLLVLAVDKTEVPGQISAVVVPRRKAAAQPRPHVLASVGVLVVLKPGSSHHLKTRYVSHAIRGGDQTTQNDLLLIPRPWMEEYIPIDLVAFEPTSAWSIPDSPISEQRCMFSVLVYRFLEWCDALDVLDLNMVNHLYDVVDKGCDHGHGASRSQGTVRPVNGEVLSQVSGDNKSGRCDGVHLAFEAQPRPDTLLALFGRRLEG